MSLTDILKLNVRGKVLLTARSTLLSDTTTVLARMFAPEQLLTSTVMVDGAHFIDADPECFQVLLNWLAYRKVLLPRNLTPESVAAVAEFYGLTDLCEELETDSQQTKKVLSKLEVAQFSETLLSGNRWGISFNRDLACPTLTQNIQDKMVAANNKRIVPTLDEKIFVLTMHPTEFVYWEKCEGVEEEEGVTLPDRALRYSQNEALYLGYRDKVQDFKTVVKGFCKFDEQWRYFVLCIEMK